MFGHSLKRLLFPDVDAPHDLTASNIQTETGMLTWKPPRADITGYILSFEAADGTVRVSRCHNNRVWTNCSGDVQNVFSN